MHRNRIAVKKRLAERLGSGKPGNLQAAEAELRLLVPAVELVDTARRVNEFLLAGEERVALRADADLHFGTGGLDVPDFAAGAGHDGIFVLRMNVFSHFLLSLRVRYIKSSYFVSDQQSL